MDKLQEAERELQEAYDAWVKRHQELDEWRRAAASTDDKATLDHLNKVVKELDEDFEREHGLHPAMIGSMLRFRK